MQIRVLITGTVCQHVIFATYQTLVASHPASYDGEQRIDIHQCMHLPCWRKGKVKKAYLTQAELSDPVGHTRTVLADPNSSFWYREQCYSPASAQHASSCLSSEKPSSSHTRCSSDRNITSVSESWQCIL